MFSELKNMRGDADQVADVCNRRASIYLPINPLKTAKINKYPVRSYRKRFGERIDVVRFSCDALFPRSYFMLKSRPGTLTSIQRN